jgi:N-acetylmuramoyl-L-alanine amidase
MKLPKLFLLITSSYLLAIFLFGCASAPSRVEHFPTYKIDGVTYLPLVSLCESRGIEWRYDTYTRSVYLRAGEHNIHCKAGESMVLVDGTSINLTHPVKIYKGTVVVPYRFKEKVLDSLFAKAEPSRPVSSGPIKIRKVVVDAGHGGTDPGAMGRSGLREKDVNLDVAKRLTKLLRERGVEVVMTRSIDTFIPLPTRVAITNNSGADLFISIHSNANRVRSLNGFEVYYVSPSVGDNKRALATAKSAPLNLGGCIVVSNSLDLKTTLWDMFYTHSRAESVTLSRALCEAVDKNLDVKPQRIKDARFEVLRGCRMPGVLVEMGYLSNASEEKMLKNSLYRQKLAESLMQGIEDYARGVNLIEVAKR